MPRTESCAPKDSCKCRKPLQITHPEHCILRKPCPYHLLSRSLVCQHACPSEHCMSDTQTHTVTPEWKTIEDGRPGVQLLICISFCELFSSQPLSIVLHKLISRITHSVHPITHVFEFSGYLKLMRPSMPPPVRSAICNHRC